MALLDTINVISNGIQKGTSALSLIPLAKKTFITGPGISASLTNTTLLDKIGSAMSFTWPTGVVPYGKSPNVDIRTNENLKLQAQITDHYVESNSAVQDHVAFEPVQFTISGEVGELVYAPSPLEQYVEAIFDRLGPLEIIKPELTLSAYQYLSAYDRLMSATNAALKVANDFAGMLGIDGYGLNKQQKTYQFFSGIYSQRTPVSVDTPWKSFDNMLIESLQFEQDESTIDKTTVTITFKELRTVSLEKGLDPLKPDIPSAAAVAKKGMVNGTQPNESILEWLTSFF